MSKQETMATLDALESKGPRVTAQMIKDLIDIVLYHRFEGTTLTVCAIVLKSGFTVLGESACADPANFDPVLGNSLAYDKAWGNIWALEGYALAKTLASERIITLSPSNLDSILKTAKYNILKDEAAGTYKVTCDIIDAQGISYSGQYTNSYFLYREKEMADNCIIAHNKALADAINSYDLYNAQING